MRREHFLSPLERQDPLIDRARKGETQRQQTQIELIASENTVSRKIGTRFGKRALWNKVNCMLLGINHNILGHVGKPPDQINPEHRHLALSSSNFMTFRQAGSVSKRRYSGDASNAVIDRLLQGNPDRSVSRRKRASRQFQMRSG